MHHTLPRLRALACVATATCLVSGAALLQGPAAIDKPGLLEVIQSAPTYWKGNLHTHSLWSDGDDFPEMIADWYQRHGYQFLTLSDHNLLSEGIKWIDAKPRQKAIDAYTARFGKDWVEQKVEKDKTLVRLKPLREFRNLLEKPGRFMLVQGEEITHRFAKAPVHINGINLRDPIAPLDGDNVAETVRANVRAVSLQGKKTGWVNVAFLNHPNFGWGVRAEDMVPVEELSFFEVYNGHPTVYNDGDKTHAGTERIWDIVLAHRLGKLGLPPIYGVATDDAHNYHVRDPKKANPGRGWIMVRSGQLTAESIVRSMLAGNFYASTGVNLDVERSGKTLTVRVVAEKGVKYRTEFVATMRGVSLESRPVLDTKGKELPVTRLYSDDIGKVVARSEEAAATYTFTGQELYVRARVVSDRPHPFAVVNGEMQRAWTQPFAP